MQINIGEIPFSGYMSRHLLYEVSADGEEKKELWLSLASESKTLFGFQGPSAPGLLLLNMTEAGRETLGNLAGQKAFRNFHVALASYAPELAKLTVGELDERMRTSTTRMNISYSAGRCKG
ncbi:MAG: hypothetical protein MJ067_03820, partial [Oscillospiraceae bacterium]|nr:hypothetical protein [Oscillospiraceae bacterium]